MVFSSIKNSGKEGLVEYVFFPEWIIPVVFDSFFSCMRSAVFAVGSSQRRGSFQISTLKSVFISRQVTRCGVKGRASMLSSSRTSSSTKVLNGTVTTLPCEFFSTTVRLGLTRTTWASTFRPFASVQIRASAIRVRPARENMRMNCFIIQNL